ncbi:hypothetical protein O181_088232 [Austropuccinia psidii MF-1]|uniref:DUF4219 domain-containing protein n=1 Tax=Austropuccinia psidii MF-1 TaxID=1389203 RepID=A0A9Q3IR55_9BASI|nr:hypothetical protein [Austropuccinia psidii MF-1]
MISTPFKLQKPTDLQYQIAQNQKVDCAFMPLKATDITNSNKDVSTLPFRYGSNFRHWSLKMKIHLRSRDLLDVCEKKIPEEASTCQAKKWEKASYEAIDIITTTIV